jgi:hypothetical protein
MLLGWRGSGKWWSASSLLLLGIPRLAHKSQVLGTQPHCQHPGPRPSLTASVGDGDRHTLDLNTIDVDGLHGLGSCCQLCRIQADDAPRGCNLWQGTLFSENCSWVLFAGPTQMGSAGCRAATGGGWGGCSCGWGAVLNKDSLHFTRRCADVNLMGWERRNDFPGEMVSAFSSFSPGRMGHLCQPQAHLPKPTFVHCWCSTRADGLPVLSWLLIWNQTFNLLSIDKNNCQISELMN